MCTVADAMLRSLRSSARAPLVVLVVVSALSFLARTALLGEPCQNPCRQAGQHTQIFDEAYYVNAARVIAGIRPPVGSHYDDAPLGTDPNAEHPQLAKLIMAAGIELFGDGPLAWRIGSLFFGSLAILGLFALVRSAGGGRWAAVAASTLMACDNLLLVHGRIGTLDIYVVAMMIWGVALYLRGRTLGSGLALAVAAAFKLVAPYALAILVLIELARLLSARRDPAAPPDWRPGPALRRLLICTFTAAGVFMGLLGIMDLIATPYDDAARHLISGGPFDHFAHIVAYATQQVSPHGPQGIASYPWWWFADLRTIVYLRVNPSLPGNGLYAITPVSKFLGMVSPPILALAVPALLFGGYRWWRRGRRVGRPVAVAERQLAIIGPAWFLGTWVPFALQALIDQRTSYLYYMVDRDAGDLRRPGVCDHPHPAHARPLAYGVLGAWGVAVGAAVVLMYPFVPVF